MKRPRHKRVPSVRRRALELLGSCPDGCTEAMLAAHDIPADVLVELVRTGYVLLAGAFAGSHVVLGEL
jgi:hypothetical protein